MRVRRMGWVLAGIVLAALASQAMATPSGWYMYNNEYYGIPDNAWTQAGAGNWSCNFQNEDPNGRFSVSGNVSISGDPQIVYGVAVTSFANNTAQFTFGFNDAWVTPLTGKTKVYGSYSASCTDATGDGISLTPVATKMQVTTINGQNMTVDVGNAFTAGPGTQGQSYDAGFDATGPKPGPIGAWTNMNTVLAFNLTGNSDVATLNGSSVLMPSQPIPEPASALLLLPGLLGVAIWRRKRS